MNTSELQSLKMAWIAAKEANDTQAQLRLLREHPEQQSSLIDFIAGFYATNTGVAETQNESLSLLTQHAFATALERVFAASPVAATTLVELRKSRGMSLVEAARGLRLTAEVWKKFEDGAIKLAGLSQRQLERLAQFFQVNADQFAILLDNSQPAISLNRRQTKEGARSKKQAPPAQSFKAAIAHSTMTEEDKQYWLAE